MTNQQIVELVVANPAVIEKYTRVVNGVPQPPNITTLQGIASSELQNELNSLLAKGPIRKEVLERSVSVTISGTTSEGRGDILTLPSTVGSVITVTRSDTELPLTKIDSLEDFAYWYAERFGSSSAPETPEAWVPWAPSASGVAQILLSPGATSVTSVKVAYTRRVSQPVQVSILPEHLHFLVVTGVLNRMTGGGFEYSYKRDLEDAVMNIGRMIGGASEMRLDTVQRAGWLRLSSMTGGNEPLWTDPNYARPY